ncbi:MAG: hypothetical protein QOC96_2084 [Acidobacteriota bacterium]|jgi:hypothetical protein|nr:hypothetical protein [Acidobacteriota bacterium]
MQFLSSRQNLTFIAVLFVALLNAACIRTSPPYQSNEMIPVGPEVKASLVIYYKADVTDEQIQEFSQQVLSRPDTQGGYYNRYGVRTILQIFEPVQGHQSTAVTFFPEATEAQREELKADVMSSPIVYKVLENVAPKDVKKLD